MLTSEVTHFALLCVLVLRLVRLQVQLLADTSGLFHLAGVSVCNIWLEQLHMSRCRRMCYMPAADGSSEHHIVVSGSCDNPPPSASDQSD